MLPLLKCWIMKSVVATAANLRGHGHFGSHRNIPNVCNMASTGSMTVFTLNAHQMWGCLFIFESKRCAISDCMAGQARAVVLLIDGSEGFKRLSVRRLAPVMMRLCMAVDARCIDH